MKQIGLDLDQFYQMVVRLLQGYSEKKSIPQVVAFDFLNNFNLFLFFCFVIGS